MDKLGVSTVSRGSDDSSDKEEEVDSTRDKMFPSQTPASSKSVIPNLPNAVTL